MSPEDSTALEKLNAAINEFAQSQRDPETDGDQGFIVSNALVVWEQVAYTDEGQVMARFRYTVPTTSTGSAALGLVVAADAMVSEHVLGDSDDD